MAMRADEDNAVVEVDGLLQQWAGLSTEAAIFAMETSGSKILVHFPFALHTTTSHLQTTFTNHNFVHRDH